jgi:hypothetical protein
VASNSIRLYKYCTDGKTTGDVGNRLITARAVNCSIRENVKRKKKWA